MKNRWTDSCLAQDSHIPELYLGGIPTGVAKTATCRGRQQRQTILGHARGAVRRDPGRYRSRCPTAEKRRCQESRDWARLAGWVSMDRRHETEDCLLGWRYQWRVHKGWGNSQSSWACPQWFYLLCALCCSWVRSFSLPLRFCGSKPHRGRADYVIISFPGQVRSPSWSLRLGLS